MQIEHASNHKPGVSMVRYFDAASAISKFCYRHKESLKEKIRCNMILVTEYVFERKDMMSISNKS
jgi:hypothetical protein